MGTFTVRIEPGGIGKPIAKRHSVRIQLPEQNKPDAQILVTGLKEDALAAVAELELMANLKLRPEHVLVSLRIKRDEHTTVLGPKVAGPPRSSENSESGW